VPGRTLRNNAFVSKLRLAWDAANTFWNNEVVQFGEAQQRWLLEKLNFEDTRWEYLVVVLILALLGFFLALTTYLAWRFRPRARDPVAHVYDQMCRKLGKLGFPRLPHEGPSDYVARVAQSRPDLAPQLTELRAVYVGLRYGPTPLATQLSRLKFLVNQLQA
jgi:hypothetical protein